MPMKPILIDALHINTGGALMILNHLVNNLEARDVSFTLLKDNRCPQLQSEDKIVDLHILSADIKTRNHYYKAHRNDFSAVLCLGNIPPAIRLDVAVHTYIHNVNLLELPADNPLKKNIGNLLKKFYICHYAKNTDTWIVQTNNTATLVRRHLPCTQQTVLEYPFYYIPNNINHIPKTQRKDYVFVGEHTFAKGHEYLIQAWTKLAHKGFDHTLHLTVKSKNLTPLIDQAISQGAKIQNHGYISFKEVVRLYNKSKATIYPSINESLGLGIVEAIEAGCDVIGCDLPYIHSVCSPSKVFKPRDPDSIVEAVLQYEKGQRATTSLRIKDMVNEFIDYLLVSRSL